MKSLPLVLLEEHHDAFLLWHIAIRRGWIQRGKNTLLHVDSHSDMVLPILRSPLPECGDVPSVQRFTYTALDIATFILPAVHQRIFNRVVYMRSEHPISALGWRRLAVQAATDGQLTLRARTGPIFNQPQESQLLDYAKITPLAPVDTDQPIILDIDLDFFCTNENPCPPVNEVETTQQVYDDMQCNPYHVLRLIPRLNVTAVKRNDRYYLTFYNNTSARETPEEQQVAIHSRMDAFVHCLRTSYIQPVLISLCRSYHSGYTPAAWVEYIQELLLVKLAELYAFDKHNLAELLAAEEACSTVRKSSLV